MNEFPYFAVLYKPGPTWDFSRHFHEQENIGDHGAFLAGQHEAGLLLFGGPFSDDAGGLSVFQSESIQQLEAILKADRSVSSGLLIYEIHPYILGFKPRS
jgi:uncharacterized protein YciI